ncbi:MAG: ATP-binding protein [Succinimonas sp.]|nr:ATP-binding protein [Succinimonas sp.]
MLIDFRVQNYLSFRASQTLSLVAGNSADLPDNLMSLDNRRKLRLLRSAAVFGANASGKSNLISALYLMKTIVTETFKPGEPLPVTPFRLSQESRESPTEFEVTFAVNGVIYQYGFSASPAQIFEEWLFVTPKDRSQRCFERVWDTESKQYAWRFGTYFQGTKQVWLKATRENALFLTTAVLLNSVQLKPVFDWFANTLRFLIGSSYFPLVFSALMYKDNEQLREKILNFMKVAEFNISNIHVEEAPRENPDLSEYPEIVRLYTEQEIKSKKTLKIVTSHLDDENQSVDFDFFNESDGTRRFFAFIGPLIDALQNGYVLCIDEINVNLHPKLFKFIVNLFHNKNTNQKNAQLIFTTHDTSVLSLNLLREDQIWFCEYNKNHHSELYSLFDFRKPVIKKISKNTDLNIEKLYLAGKYGALPFIGDAEDVL